MYGHVEKLAEEIKKGAASVEGVEAKLWQVGMMPISKKVPSAIWFFELFCCLLVLPSSVPCLVVTLFRI